MNAILGTNDLGETFFLTNGSTIKALEDGFEEFLTDLGVDHVGFAAGDGGNSRKLSPSEESLMLDGGLDCREVHHPVEDD